VKKPTDEHLMNRVKKGNLDALSPLFEKYHVKLYNFFLRLTGNPSQSQDLTQNVFKRILSYRESYDSNKKFRSWMYQIARNVHLDYLNETKIRISDFTEPEQYKYDQENAFEMTEAKTREKALYEALALMPPEQREILELSKFQGLRYKEISEITGNSVAAIKVKVHRAIKKLKELYFETV
jgi:RNA polymerase sigma-70 factor (ECF subfamily)